MRGSRQGSFEAAIAPRRGARAALLGALAVAALLPGSASAQGGSNLDRLLRLPDTYEYSTEEKGGATRSEWRQRFAEATTALTEAEKTLAASQKKLSEVAGEKSQWQFSPPGVPAQSTEDSSASYQLREQVRRQRAEVDRAKARLRELDVRANLAGVPEEWRTASTNARSSDAVDDGSGTRPGPVR
jgi:hypothetical protein